MTRAIRKHAPEGATAFELVPNDATGTSVIYWREGVDGLAEMWRYGKWWPGLVPYEAKLYQPDVHSLGFERWFVGILITIVTLAGLALIITQ